MDYYDIAKLLPSHVRKLILNNNFIFKAVIKFDDFDMMQLWFYWSNFIEPESELYKYEILNNKIVVEYQCLVCLGELLSKWKKLLPSLILIEQESNLLNEL